MLKGFIKKCFEQHTKNCWVIEYEVQDLELVEAAEATNETEREIMSWLNLPSPRFPFCFFSFLLEFLRSILYFCQPHPGGSGG